MGVSTNAILAFGVNLGDELPDLLHELMRENDFDDVVCDILGFHGDYKTDPDYYKKRQKVLDSCPVELIYHCSGEYPMYFLAIKGTEIKAYRGEAQEVNLPTIAQEQLGGFFEWCEKLGVENTEPKWMLFSYWG